MVDEFLELLNEGGMGTFIGTVALLLLIAGVMVVSMSVYGIVNLGLKIYGHW